jgi:tetratricopeptide (TPR) repeat protein
MNIATYEQQRGNFRAAIDRYQKVVGVTRNPELKVAALNSMGRAYRQLGDEEHARECFAAAANVRQ